MSDTQINTARVLSLVFGGKKKRKVNGQELPPFTAKTVTIDWNALPEASRDKIIEYGLTQFIADGTAGAGDQTDFDSGIDAKVAKLLSGDFSRTSGGNLSGSAYDSVDKLTTAKVRDMIKGKLKAANITVDADKRAAMITAFMSDPAKVAPFREAAEREIEAQKVLASGTGLDDLMKDLGI